MLEYNVQLHLCTRNIYIWRLLLWVLWFSINAPCYTRLLRCRYYRQDCREAAKQPVPVLNLLTCRKSAFSPRRGDSLHRFTWNLAQPRGTRVRLPCKISRQSVPGVGTRPQSGKNFHFLVKSRPIYTFVRGFYTPNHPALVFYIWDDSLHWLQSYCWETARQSFNPNFSVHPVGKSMLWIENCHLLEWARRSLSPCKIWGRSYIGCRCENIVFVCFVFFFCLSCCEVGRLFVRGMHS